MQGERDERREGEKKPYLAPRLEVYGTLAEITMSGTSGNADGLNGSVIG